MTRDPDEEREDALDMLEEEAPRWICSRCRSRWHVDCWGVRDNGDTTVDHCACHCRMPDPR